MNEPKHSRRKRMSSSVAVGFCPERSLRVQTAVFVYLPGKMNSFRPRPPANKNTIVVITFPAEMWI